MLAQQTFQDPEDLNATARFAMIPALLQESAQAVAPISEWIAAWIRNPPSEDDSVAYQAYTIAERLANWGIFLCRSRAHEGWPPELQNRLAASVHRQAELLLSRLEYHGESLTGNHLSNNGRGLLWAALLLRRPKIAKLASEILTAELVRIVLPGGTLREGSSHYQFLITRNFLECLWLARELGVADLVSLLKQRLPSMLEACRILRWNHGLSFVGDLSPDVSPAWLEQVPEAGAVLLGTSEPMVPAAGWAAQFGTQVALAPPSPTSVRDEFARYEGAGFSLLVHINSAGSPALASHAHHDSGSLVASHEGRPLLLDSGRPSYLAGDLPFRDSEAHNSLWIDGEAPEIWPRRFFGPGYLRHRLGAQPTLRLLEDGIETELHSYSRQGIRVTRRYRVKGDELLLENRVEGSGKHLLRLFLHTPASSQPKISWPENGVSRSEPAVGSTGYGERLPILRCSWEGRVQLPWTGTIRVSPPEAN